MGTQKRSFGYYGGPNCKFISHPVGARGYEQKQCVLCDRVALYRCGADGYCRNHKGEAVKRLSKRAARIEKDGNIPYRYQ